MTHKEEGLPQLVTRKEVAGLLRVHQRTIARRKDLKPVFIGKLVRYKAEDVAALIKGRL